MRLTLLQGIFSVAVAGLTLSATGCGPASGSLSGTVTLDGKPLKGGRVDFANKSGGRSATVELNDDGTYTLSDVKAGDYAVSVNTSYLKGTSPMAAGKRGGGGAPKMKNTPPAGANVPEGYAKEMQTPNATNEGYKAIPSKYEDPASSGLTYTFPGGQQTYDIALTSK